VKALGGRKGSQRHPTHIPSLNPKRRERRAFIVADIETVLENDVQVPYAAGFLVVNPGEDVAAKSDFSIETYFSEDYILLMPEFRNRSNKMLFGFLERLAVVASEKKIVRVFFHNFSRFDGILLMKYYATHGYKYKIKPLFRNHRLYELKVYRGNSKTPILSIRDSMHLLPGSLSTLGKT